jgi:hypothetical protein
MQPFLFSVDSVNWSYCFMNILNLRPFFTPHLWLSIINVFFFIIYVGFMSTILWEDRPTALRHSLPLTHDDHDSAMVRYTEKSFLDTVQRRGRINYNLQGQKTLVSLKKDADYLIQNHWIEVLAVNFDSSNTYGDFVRLINFCLIHGIKRYVFIDNTMYIFPYEYF